MPGKNVDLHIHSTASDGTNSPAHIIELAMELELSAIALTDHDTVSGLEEFIAAAAARGIEVVPGVEISTSISGREIHILGLFIDYRNPELTAFLEKIRIDRNQRNENMIMKLRSLGYDITLEELKDKAGGESVGRPHLAALLIEKGYFKDNKEAFERCLRRGGPGYCHRQLPSPSDSIAQIHNAGGIAIWAHPVYRNKYARSHVRSVIKKLKPFGLDGIEGYYPGYTEHQHRMLLELAEEYELTVSGGTDFHGSNIPQIALGGGNGDLEIPETCFLELKKYWQQKNNG